MHAGPRERAVLAPDVLAVALAVPGGPCARALERVVDGGADLVISTIVLRATLARLVTLFDLDAEAVARTALLLHELGDRCDVGEGVTQVGIDPMVGHLATLCAVASADALVVAPGDRGFDAFATGAFARGAGWLRRPDGRAGAGGYGAGTRRGPRPATPMLRGGTRLVLARDFARAALVRERGTPALSDRMLRLEAIAAAVGAPGRRAPALT